MPAPILVALLVISWRGGQKAWLQADFFGTVATGISLLLTPRVILEFVTEVRLDNVSIHLARVAGILLLCQSMDTHRALSLSTKTDWAYICKARALTAFMMLLATMYAHQHYSVWSFRFAPFAIVGTVCWLLPHTQYALQGRAAALSGHRASRFFLTLDCFMTATAGIAWYAYPQWLLKGLIQIKPNGVSVTVARTIGSLLVGLAAVSLGATNFPCLQSKRSLHQSRILTSISLTCLLFYAETLEKAFNTVHVIVGVCTVTVWAVNAILGYAILAYMNIASAEDKKRRDRTVLHKSNTDPLPHESCF